MTRNELIAQIRQKQSYLCIGLDTDMDRIPPHLTVYEDPQFEFNRQIIDATVDQCVAYKINTAFYESQGTRGWEAMQRTAEYIPSSHFIIADAKRGDIGNTSSQYAKAFFETMNFDAITVAPYMGSDSVAPFLQWPGKWTIMLGLTSNSGSADFELLRTGDSYLFEEVLKKGSEWGNPGNMMFVIGATQHEMICEIRKSFPEYFFLVPGVGAQGGSLSAISASGMNDDIGLLVNVSRDIIFSSSEKHFAIAASMAASRYRTEMAAYLSSL